MPEEFELTILIPCLNEIETLETCIRKARSFLESNQISGEVMVADNGSTDGSREVAVRAGAHLVEVPTRGYGSALIGGIQAARSTYIIMGDGDDSYDFTSLMPFVDELRKGADLVMGNRFKGGIKPGAMPFLHRYLGNPVLSFLGRLFFKSKIGDFHSGLRGFKRDAMISLNLQTTGMEFASEMVVKAVMHGLKITEVPIILYKDGRNRAPHLRTWRDGWRHLRFLLLYSPDWLFFYPGLALILLGLILVVWLVGGPKMIGRVEFDIHTMLFGAVFILLGFQSTYFALFTRAFGVSEGLLPEEKKWSKILNQFTIERGLLIGGGLFIAGIAGMVLSFVYWGEVAFGNLDTLVTMRIVIMGMIFIITGFETMLSSFFLGILGLKPKSK